MKIPRLTCTPIHYNNDNNNSSSNMCNVNFRDGYTIIIIYIVLRVNMREIEFSVSAYDATKKKRRYPYFGHMLIIRNIVTNILNFLMHYCDINIIYIPFCWQVKSYRYARKIITRHLISEWIQTIKKLILTSIYVIAQFE